MLAQSSNVTIQVSDNSGRIIDKIKLGSLEFGSHYLEWENENSNINSSIYFFKVITDIRTKNLKLFNN